MEEEEEDWEEGLDWFEVHFDIGWLVRVRVKVEDGFGEEQKKGDKYIQCKGLVC